MEAIQGPLIAGLEPLAGKRLEPARWILPPFAPILPIMMKKLYIQTHGCQMNEYDSARMADVLRESHGLELAAYAEEADVLLLNTCSIREKAQEKVFSALGRWRPLKQQRPDLVIGVGGCVASQEGEALRERAPFVDLVFGPQTLHRLPGMLRELAAGRGPLYAGRRGQPALRRCHCRGRGPGGAGGARGQSAGSERQRLSRLAA